MEENKGQILLYQTPDGESRIEVRLEGETVWLNLDQMAELFQRNKSTISRHIKNVFEEGELNNNSVVAFFATTARDGKSYNVEFFNLDMIISVGYRVHSYRGVQFRMWATKVLKEYIVKGFALNDDLLKLDDFLRISRKDILTHAGRISTQLAKAKADAEYGINKDTCEGYGQQLSRNIRILVPHKSILFKRKTAWSKKTQK